MPKILIVEDEPQLARFVQLELEHEEYETVISGDGREGLTLAEGGGFDLILLDIMLPGLNGLEVLRRLRKAEDHTPVIMLTARDSVMDKVSGLDMGADDYITKPFNSLEVVARVKTQLRRYRKYNQPANSAEEQNEYDIRGLVINNDSHKCTLFGKELQLTPIEFSILWYLCENRGRVVSSEELFEAVWKEKYFNSNNTVMAHIGRLREKMHEPARNPKFIKTVWGVGYEIE